MSEQLIIRLASDIRQSINWLIWSDNEKEIIGSGEVENAEALEQLAEKAQSRKVVCLLPSVDVILKSVPITGSFTRQMQQALPYMLEDELASDVDKLHFSVLAKETDLIHVAICAKTKIEMWLGWLKEAGIESLKFIPEALALPLPSEDKWQALQLDNHWVIRESLHNGWGCESEMLSDILQLRLIDNLEQTIESYCALPENAAGEWQLVDTILPMQLLAEGCVDNNFNILTGEFKTKKVSNLNLDKWKAPAIAVVVFFIVAMSNLFIQNNRVEKQTLQVQEQVETVYKKAFPRERALKFNRIKKKVTGLLKDISGTNTEVGLLVMLNDLIPVFKAVPSLEISTLKFNSKKKEINLSVSADSFQAFEQLAKKIPAKYELEQGALNNSKNRVSGALTVRGK